MHLERLERTYGWDAIVTADHDPERAKPRPTLYLEALDRARRRRRRGDRLRGLAERRQRGEGRGHLRRRHPERGDEGPRPRRHGRPDARLARRPPAGRAAVTSLCGMSVFLRHTLSNGLRVLTAPLDHAQSVACYVMLAAGSRYEHAENRGIAHFSEHMFFKGTERRPTARDIAMEVDSIGGEFNAFTSKEYTGYYIRCAAAQRDQAFDVLVDMLRNSKFDPEELEREKGVIIEEMNMYVDTPRDYVGSVYEELLFGSNPLGWETLGTKQTIQDTTRDTFLDYIGEWYTPERMVVGVAGAVGDERAADARRAARRPRRHRARRTRFRPRSSGRPSLACGCTRRTPTRRTSRSASRRTRSAIRIATRCSSSAPCSARACRRGSSSRCASAAGSPTTSSRSTTRSRTPARSTRRAGVDLKRAEEAVEVIAKEFKKLARGARADGGAREGARAREGPLRAADREPERPAPLGAAPRGARRARRPSRRRSSPGSTPSPSRTCTASRRT